MALGPTLKAEPVSKNHFFQVLKQTYHQLYSFAANKGWKICVPHSTSIRGATLNEHFFRSHILQSSPYFKEEYVTLNGQCVICKNGSISTKTGFHSPRKVRVLGEELFYTESFKSFTVYSISGPLVGVQPVHSPHSAPTPPHHRGHPLRRHQSHDPYSTAVPPSNRLLRSSSSSHSRRAPNGHHNALSPHSPSLTASNGRDRESISMELGRIAVEDRNEDHWKTALSLYLPAPIYKKLMEDTVAFGDQFNRSYVMIKGYSKAAARRIEEFRNCTFDWLLSADPLSECKGSKSLKSSKGTRARNGPHHRGLELSGHRVDELQCALDSYLNSMLFGRVFNSFLVRQYKAEDAVFRKQLHLLRSLSQSAIGIKPQFESDDGFQSAVSHLVGINAAKTPKQKLGVLQQTMQRIRQCIERQNEVDALSAKSLSNGRHHRRRGGGGKNEDMALTTEDMLPLFTFVLIHSEMEHIESENEYIQHFYFPSDCTAHLTYFAATLQAAIQFCKDQLFQKKEVKLQRRKNTSKRPKIVNRFGRSRSEFDIQPHHNGKAKAPSTNPFDL